MKTDMSGAAIVLGALAACADSVSRSRVTALAPITENMPGGRAMKPGDVLTIRNGTTIEVLNTDAEGRLILADALVLAAELESPDAIVDVATLTGAARVALGTGIAPLFGNDDGPGRPGPCGRPRGPASRLWPMPLPEDYREHLDSEVADMKNIGAPRPGRCHRRRSCSGALCRRPSPGPTSTSPVRGARLRPRATSTKGATPSGCGRSSTSSSVSRHRRPAVRRRRAGCRERLGVASLGGQRTIFGEAVGRRAWRRRFGPPLAVLVGEGRREPPGQVRGDGRETSADRDGPGTRVTKRAVARAAPRAPG